MKKYYMIYVLLLSFAAKGLAGPYDDLVDTCRGGYNNTMSRGFVIDQPSGNRVYVRPGLGKGYVVDDNSGQNTYVRPGLGGYIIDNGSGINTYVRPY